MKKIPIQSYFPVTLIVQKSTYDLGLGRHVGSSELSADCSDKDGVLFVPTKNFRTSNLFRTFLTIVAKNHLMFPLFIDFLRVKKLPKTHLVPMGHPT